MNRPRIAVMGTFDTKAEEYQYIIDRIGQLGADVLTIDVSTRDTAVLRGEYGKLPGTVNEEVRAKAGIKPEDVITCRPADLLEPELPKYREEYKDLAKSEEDVLSLALFPQVAPKFINRRNLRTPKPHRTMAPIAHREAKERAVAPFSRK